MSRLLPPELADCAYPWKGTRQRAIAAGIIAALSSVGLLALSGWFITAAAIAGTTGSLAVGAFNYLIPSAMIRLLAILRTGMRYAERLLSHRAALSTLASLRSRLFAKAASAEAQGVLRLSGGAAATLLGQDVDQLEDRLIRGPVLAGGAAGALVAVGVAMVAGPGPALSLAACLASAAWLTHKMAWWILPARTDETAKALADLKISLTEYAAGAGEIAVYGLSDQVAQTLQQSAAKHDSALARVGTAEAAIMALIPAATGIATALILATARSGAALAAMAALAAVGAGEALGGLARAEIKAPSSKAALGRLQALVAVTEARIVRDVSDRPDIAIISEGHIEQFEPGTRVAIVGRSGTGKTRILETLAGLRSDAPEKLEVDGRDIKEIGLYQLREWFALVPQDPMLLAGTIQDNLRIARPSLEEADLWDVLTTACLDKDVEGFPDGLQQWIGEGGLELSGGQRKRLALARGLLARRPWLLLDEPSEGLDESTERLLLTRLSKWLSNTSGGLLLVTHRPALLHLCDRKILLDERLGNRAQ